MVRVALPSYDIHTLNGTGGGIATFLVHFARLLKANGDDVTIIPTCNLEQSTKVDKEWQKRYDAWGINLLYVPNGPHKWHCGNDLITLSQQVASAIENFDVAYFMDWGNVAFHTVRKKRFTSAKMPVCITVLHGASNWIRALDRTHPNVTSDLHLDYMERYGAEHSDYVVSASRALLDFVRDDGWKFKRQPEVLGLPIIPATETAEYADVPKFENIRRLLFFGRLETRKNYQLFVNAILRIGETAPDALSQVDEIVFLGKESEVGAFKWIRERLAPLKLKVLHLGNKDNVNAKKYLATVAKETLAVIPTLYENLTYAGIEASLIPGLNLICTNGGGTPEIFAGRGEKQLFEPTIDGLTAKILERLTSPLTPEQLVSYDYNAANERWLEFHRRVCEHVQTSENIARETSISVQPHHRSKNSGPSHSVDVCVTFYNKQKHFAQTLRSLENQTTSDFSVIVVDDGSPDPEAVTFFDAMARKYASRGWTFFHQENRFVDRARNAAAKRGQAEYLLMLDGDDLLAPNAIERLLEAARLSGDDCLVTSAILFQGDDYPIDKTGFVTAAVIDQVTPLGPNLSAALFEPWILGGHMILIRREVFEAVGGYRELRGVNHEDWELHLRLAFSGYRVDVLPESLHLYRQNHDGLSKGADMYRAQRRLIDVYNKHLGAAGVQNGGDILIKLYKRCAELEERLFRYSMQPQHDGFSVEVSPDSGIGNRNDFYHELDVRFGKGDDGPPVMRELRRFYRKQIPLKKRLELHHKLMSIIRSRSLR